MEKYLLFVDVETSGIPDSMHRPVTAEHHWPYLLQVAWQVFDLSGNLIKTENHYIYEEDIHINKSSEKIHGITLEDLKIKGERRKEVMRLLGTDIRHYEPTLVGHYVEFDSKMLQVGMTRSGLKNIIKGRPHFCTMLATSEYTRFTNHNYPKLEELYQSLFHEKMEVLHDALGDVQATARCFFELVRKGDIHPEKLNTTHFASLKNTSSQRSGCGLPVLVLIIFLVWMIL